MIVTDSNTSTFTPCPAGAYLASLRRMIDLGTQTSTFEGKTHAARKVLFVWEVTDPDIFTDTGKPYTVAKRYTRSLHEKSALRKDLASWRGRDFSADELKSFDLDAVLGKPCLLSIVHVEKDGKTFANVAAVMRPAKGMTGSDPTEPLVQFDLAAPDWHTFDALGDRIKAQIMAAPEYLAARTAAPSTPAPAGTGFDDMDDDIPF